jgi:type I restriction enzyme S subunit
MPAPTEQRRIVAILDEAFDGITFAKAAAERNLQNARGMFEGYLEAVFSQRGQGWVSKTIRQWVGDGVLARPQDGNHGEIHPTKADFVEVGVPFIMAADLVKGMVDVEGCRFLTKTQAGSLRIGFAKTGDVLLSHKGTIGRVAILDTTDDYVMLTPQVTYYRSLDSNRLFNGFLYYALQDPAFQAALKHIAGAGSTRAYIGITRQLDLQLALPPIDVQRQLAVRLRHIDQASNTLAGVYQAKLTTLDELKAALLHQAFVGALPAASKDQQLEAMA